MLQKSAYLKLSHHVDALVRQLFCCEGQKFHFFQVLVLINIFVPDPGNGRCADPVSGGAILGKGGPDPKGGNKERQLSPDKGRGKTW